MVPESTRPLSTLSSTITLCASRRRSSSSAPGWLASAPSAAGGAREEVSPAGADRAPAVAGPSARHHDRSLLCWNLHVHGPGLGPRASSVLRRTDPEGR